MTVPRGSLYRTPFSLGHQFKLYTDLYPKIVLYLVCSSFTHGAPLFFLSNCTMAFCRRQMAQLEELMKFLEYGCLEERTFKDIVGG